MTNYLLVEGITDIAFVKYVCLKNSIINNFDDFKQINRKYLFKNLAIINMEGQGNLDTVLSFLVSQDAKIKKIGIIEDADNDFETSQENIKKSIKKAKINPSKIKHFLTPNNKDTGDLETLLLSTVKDNNIVECFADYEKCLLADAEIFTKALNKGQVYAYTMYSQKGKDLHKPQDSFISKKNKDTGLWDLNKAEFQPIIKFILEVFKK